MLVRCRSAGMFCYKEGAGCEIRLSENVLKFRSAADLKKILLHEMIHAYLYITSNKRDRRYDLVSRIADCMCLQPACGLD